MNRRHWLKGIGTSALLSSLPSIKLLANTTATPRHTLRIAHITDVHLQHDKGAPEALTKCLNHLQNLSPAPHIIFNGGDTIDDALLHSKYHVQNQWNLWNSIIKNNCSLPIEHCIGNHDVWGLITEKSDALYGKKFALEMMQLDTTYRSFDMNGWHFIILDSTHEKENSNWYTAKLGSEQMEWLKSDLEATHLSTPICIVSHIPILSATVFFDDAVLKNGNFKIPEKLMHSDVKDIVKLFVGYPNIKLCLSGHIHLYDHVAYNGISYYCNGAVCGNWWDSPYYHETKAGYAIIDLYDDGSFENQYVHYCD